MELHAFRYPNLHSAILGEIFSIRFQPHQAVYYHMNILLKKYFYWGAYSVTNLMIFLRPKLMAYPVLLETRREKDNFKRTKI